MSASSELASLVETEHRLDDTVASARKAAGDARLQARERAAAATAKLVTEIEAERARIASAVGIETAAQEHAVEVRARAAVARYEAVRGDALDRLAHLLADRLLAMVREDL